MRKLLATTALLVSTLGIARTASATAVKLPGWCSTPGFDDVMKHENANVDEAIKKDDIYFPLFYLAVASCTPKGNDDLDDRRGELDAARAYWSKKLDMTDADWGDVAQWSQVTQSMRYAGLGQIRFDTDEERKKAWSAYNPFEQYEAIAGGSWRDDLPYLTDALGDKLSQLGRFAFIEQCLTGGDAPEVRWAVCQPDIDALDPAKLAAELRATPPNYGWGRMLVRIEVMHYREGQADHAAAVKALIAKDAAYGKLFEISTATRKEWAARAASNAPLLALVLAMDDARITNSRKAYDGCADTTWAAWTAAVGKIPAKTFAGLRDDKDGIHSFMDQALSQIAADPEAWLASLAYVSCRGGDHDRLVQALAGYVENAPGFRGPRTATIQAIGNTKIELDDRNAHISMPFSDRSRWFDPGADELSGSGSGQVASVKTSGGKTHVVFVSKMVKQTQCAESRETNHVTAISDDGTVRYQYVCVRNETVTVNKAADPQDVDARYAAGIKGGVEVSLMGSIVQAVWAKNGASTPSYVFGVAVK